MAQPSLQLLSHRVDVAKAAFQWMVVEDRRGAGSIVSEVDRLACLVDGVGGGHAHSDAPGDRNHRAGAEMLPDFSHRLQHEAARGTQIDLRLCKVRLDHCIVLDRAFAAARYLVFGEVEETVERTACDAARNAGKADLITGSIPHAVK